jgi:hypothetical protein
MLKNEGNVRDRYSVPSVHMSCAVNMYKQEWYEGSDEHMSADEKIKDHSSTREFSQENQLEQLWRRADD